MTKRLPALRKLKQGVGHCRNTCKEKTYHKKLVSYQRNHNIGGQDEDLGKTEC